MPITPERQNIEELRAAGFSEAQSILLATKFEATAQAVSEDLKTFMVAELDRRFSELHSDLNVRFAQIDARFAQIDARFAQIDARFAQVEARFAQVEARFESALRAQMATILTAYLGITTLAVAIIKLF